MNSIARQCEWCKAEFKPKRREQKCCSTFCRSSRIAESSRRQTEGMIFICRECGNSYRPNGIRQLYCGRICRNSVHNRSAQKGAWNLRRYGLTRDDYEDMVQAQCGKCAICGREPDGQGHYGRLFVDHSHSKGSSKVRSLLCGQCNVAIGMMKDDPARLRAAADYLERHENG